MRAYLLILLIIVAGLVGTVWLPFVNRPVLWLDIPSVMLWTVVGVVLLTPTLFLIERARRGDDEEGDR